MASLTTIEGIGAKYRKALLNCGVRSTGALLSAGCDRKGRRALAKESGCSANQILEWVNRADLMRVKGVGEEYSDLLEAAGVDTVKELRTRNPANLHTAMLARNTAKKRALVRRPPGLSEVKRWVAHAKRLKPMVTH